MAIFSVIDTSASGDYFDEGMVKDAANWAVAEAALSAATTTILKGGGAGIVPVMTTVTGTGAPVCATSPALVTPTVDHIGEVTSGHGVNIDGVTLKDGGATILTGGTNTFNLTNGTAVLDIAAGATLNIDTGLQVTTNAGTLAFSAASKTLTVNESVTLNAQPVGGLAVATSANVLGSLAVGTALQVLIGGGAGTVPAWGTNIPTAVTIGSKYIYRTDGTDVPVADGGTGASTLADGGLVCGNGTGAVEVVAPGATTTILVGGGAATAPVWTTATGSGSPVRATSPTLVTPLLGTPTSGTLTNCTGLPVAGGGTGAATLADGGLVCGNGTGAVEVVAPGATTTILVGGGAATAPVWTTATGSGSPVRATSPELVTPNLGTPSAGVLSSCTAGSEGAKGVLLLATTAEVVTGTDTAKAVTAAGVTAHLASPKPIGETAPNSIRGINKEVFFTSTDTATAVECSGTIVSNYGMTDADMVLTLPAAAEGLSFVCVLPAVRAKYFRLTSAGTDKIYLAGVVGTGPGYVGVASGYGTGTSCSMFTFKASDGGYDWFCIPLYGTWVAG